MTSNSKEKAARDAKAEAAGDPETTEEYSGRSGGGDSGGGDYPNPHRGKEPKQGGFLGHGGQTEMAYHGKGQLGDQTIEGNENAPAGKAGSASTAK
jgi:hypothetical protein